MLRKMVGRCLSYRMTLLKPERERLRSAPLCKLRLKQKILPVIRGRQSGRTRLHRWVDTGTLVFPISKSSTRPYSSSRTGVLDSRSVVPLHQGASGPETHPDLLQRCMLQEYFASGVVLLDTPSYERFFGPSINAATTTYQAERDKYLKAFPEKTTRALDGAFESTPDLQKPFFVQQMGWKVAREEEKKAIAAQQRAVVAKAEAEAAVAELQKIQQERDKDWRRRKRARALQLEAEERNARDPKHRQKRDRQAKNRSRKRKH